MSRKRVYLGKLTAPEFNAKISVGSRLWMESWPKSEQITTTSEAMTDGDFGNIPYVYVRNKKTRVWTTHLYMLE